MKTIKEINAEVSREYRAAVKQVRRDNPTCGFIRSQSKMLVAGNADGQRVNDPIYFTGPVKLGHINAMKQWPGVTNIHAQGEAVAYERMTDEDEEGSENWDVLVWCTPASYAAEQIDTLVARRTGFTSLPDMFDAAPTYRPSCDVRDPDMKRIADAYDARAEAFGDPRRAYRYGETK